MKKAIVYFLLIVAISSLVLSFTPRGLGAVEDVKIINYTYRFDASGILVVVGEVQNIGQGIISTVIISGIATPSYGPEVVSGDLAWANNLLPGQKAPFYMELRTNLTSNGAWVGGLSDVNVRVIQASPASSYQYQDVIITSHQWSQSGGVYTASGEIKNNGAQTATNAAVVGTFYNSAGKPVAVGYSTKVATMAPEGVNSFSLTAININQTTVTSDTQVSSYSLMVQVEQPLLSGNPPMAKEPITGPNDSEPSGSTNNLSPTYIAAFVVAIIVVIAAWVLIKRRKSLNSYYPNKHNANRRVSNKKHRRK